MVCEIWPTGQRRRRQSSAWEGDGQHHLVCEQMGFKPAASNAASVGQRSNGASDQAFSTSTEDEQAQDPTGPAYTPFYCEENVYLLLEDLATRHSADRHYALFISNPARTCLLFHQRASTRSESSHYVIWDYHVVVVTVENGATGEVYVLDADSLLSPRNLLDGKSASSIKTVPGLNAFCV